MPAAAQRDREGAPRVDPDIRTRSLRLSSVERLFSFFLLVCFDCFVFEFRGSRDWDTHAWGKSALGFGRLVRPRSTVDRQCARLPETTLTLVHTVYRVTGVADEGSAPLSCYYDSISRRPFDAPGPLAGVPALCDCRGEPSLTFAHTAPQSLYRESRAARARRDSAGID